MKIMGKWNKGINRLMISRTERIWFDSQSRVRTFVRFNNISPHLSRSLNKSVLLKFAHPDSVLPSTVMLCPIHLRNIWRGVPKAWDILNPPVPSPLLNPDIIPSLALCIRLSSAYRSLRFCGDKMQENFLGLSVASGCLNQPVFQRPTVFVITISPRRFHCTFSLCYSLNVSDQVSHPCKTTLTVNGQRVNFLRHEVVRRCL
jgi:hypothetical protein